jgi:hypothetical protein
VHFTRALYAGGQNHAGPANLLSGASRLSGFCASLRPSARRGAAYGLGFVFMHDGVFKQRVQPLDFLNLSSIARKSEGGSYLSAEALA